ncbi:MAG: hypothetical protein IPM56_19035 [Ignavibacteriales bacterium]|nr:MAG: hypothetical protein IPM56_19035 [Ignavibacteriales bacterium]
MFKIFSISKINSIGITFLLISNSLFAFTSSEFRYSDSTAIDSSIWGLQIGYFPNYNKFFASAGISVFAFNELILPDEIHTTYYYNVMWAPGKPTDYTDLGGGGSIGICKNYCLKNNSDKIIIRAGAGYATYGISGLLMIDYSTSIGELLSLTFSLSQQIAGFRKFLPVYISIGISY